MNKIATAFVAAGASGAAAVAIATGLIFGGGSTTASARLASDTSDLAPRVSFASIASSRSADDSPIRLTTISSTSTLSGLTAKAPAAADDVDPPADAPPADPAPPVDAPAHYGVDPSQSSAKLIAYETGLLGDSSAVGTGSNINGEVFLTQSGGLGDGASWMTLDMRTLRSSDIGLSGFLTSDLEASKFPTATFNIASVSGIPANYQDGNPFTFTMSGPLSMHGHTVNVTWSVRSRATGDYLTMAADTDFNLTDFGWTPPDYGIERAKNGVHLQIVSVAGRLP